MQMVHADRIEAQRRNVAQAIADATGVSFDKALASLKTISLGGGNFVFELNKAIRNALPENCRGGIAAWRFA